MSHVDIDKDYRRMQSDSSFKAHLIVIVQPKLHCRNCLSHSGRLYFQIKLPRRGVILETSSKMGNYKMSIICVVVLSICSRLSHGLVNPSTVTSSRDLRFQNYRSPSQSNRYSIDLQTTNDDTLFEELREKLPPKLLSSQSIGIGTYLTVFGILPVLSFFTFDKLLSEITDFDLAAADRQLWIIALLLSKRLYIYALALTTLDLAAKRSIELPGSLGKVRHLCN